MNICFKYDKNEIKFEERINELKEYIENNESTYNIKILSKITNRSKCDIYIIISDKINEIYEYLDLIKDKSQILIITSNITASHILNCTNVTNNLTYLGNRNEVILNRINNIYERSKNE